MNDNKSSKINERWKYFLLYFVAPVITGILVLLFGHFVLRNGNPSDTKKNVEIDSLNQEIGQPPIEPRQGQHNEKQTITVSGTGTGSHYYEDKAIEKAKENAVNNLKSNYGLTDSQIMNREFSISKIDSLQDNIRVTVKVSAKIKK